MEVTLESPNSRDLVNFDQASLGEVAIEFTKAIMSADTPLRTRAKFFERRGLAESLFLKRNRTKVAPK